MIKHYEKINMDIWQGRVDSQVDFDAFRWHQWIEPLNILKPSISKPEALAFGIIGFRCDEGIKYNKGRQGAKNAPNHIRKELRNLPCQFDEHIKIYDVGNINFYESLASTQEALSVAISKILDLGLFPIVLGGGHEVAFGHYQGLEKSVRNKSSKIGIINFDAHFDIRPYPNGGTSGTMFRQIYDASIMNDKSYDYFCLGIQRYGNTKALFKSADKMGINYVLAKDISHNNLWDVMMKLDDFITKQDHIYITICSDVFSSAYAPGVSAAQPLGIHPEDFLKLLKYILRMNKTISFDIAEVSPRFDYDRTTANLASVIIFSVVNTLSKMYDFQNKAQS